MRENSGGDLHFDGRQERQGDGERRRAHCTVLYVGMFGRGGGYVETGHGCLIVSATLTISILVSTTM